MQLKRLISFCVAVLMLIVAAAPLSATENETFEVGVEVGTEAPISSNPQIFRSGDEISVRIFATQNTGISFLSFDLYFDRDAFTLESVTDNHLFGMSSVTLGQEEKGFVRYLLNSEKTVVTATGLLFEATFTPATEFDGTAEFAVSIRSEKNCSKYETSSTNSHVPFVADTATVSIHHITEPGTVTAPTCTEDGYTAYTCANCSEPVIGSRTPATGHTIVTHEAKAPTCAEIGWAAYETCENCDYTTYTELPLSDAHTGNTLIRDAVEPTVDADGYTGDTYCTDCGAKLADGEPIPRLIEPGDVNADGKISLADVSLLLKYAAKWDVEFDLTTADVTADGVVNLSDAALILKYIAKWDVVLG